MSKHTPGPWETKHHGEWITGKDAVHGEVVIAKAEFDWEANARLIAAAPDLLNAVCFLLSNLDNRISKADRDTAYNAIAKATGETE